MNRGGVGRADLARLIGRFGRGHRASAAALLGFVREEEKTVREEAPGPLPTVLPTPAEPVSPAPPTIIGGPLAPTPFWWPTAYARRALAEATQEPPPPVRPDWQGGAPPCVLRTLAPWRELGPRLQALAGAWSETKEIDVDAVVRDLGRGRQPDRLPRHRRRRWPPCLQLVLDRSDRLAPFWQDQSIVHMALGALLPEHRLELALVDEVCVDGRLLPPRAPATDYRCPSAGSVVLVLGDLGCLADRSEVRRWLQRGHALLAAGCRPAALLPCPIDRCPPELRRIWNVAAWERSSRRSGHEAPELQRRAERLLRLVAPAVRIEPGLLRAVRHLLHPSEADAGTEADVWNHPAVASRHVVGATLRPDAATALRAGFADEVPPPLQRAVLDMLRRWRHGQPFELWAEEIINLPEHVVEQVPDLAELAAASDLFAWVRDQHVLRGGHGGATAWLRRVAKRATADGWKQREFARAIHAVKRDDPSYAPPATVDPAWLEGEDRDVRTFELRQQGGRLVVARPREGTGVGSLVGSIRSRNGLIRLLPTDRDETDRQAFWTTGRAPAWARDWGRDEHGPWVSFTVVGADGVEVTQHMRWCPPGPFMMGSPGDEVGRYDNEGPYHRVTFTRGFWMFATTVTRALWLAVMGASADAHADGLDLPVTDVSWDDARAFVAALNTRLPGLELSLPSEAQWEYACRAGTDTPYHFGHAIDRTRVNYGGDGPVPVASLPANGWGLHEMRGNVWEWCADHWHASYRGAPSDGSAWLDEDTDGPALRVVRGGSWYVDARNVRAASRIWYGPSRRDGYLGFRCAREGMSFSAWEAVPAAPTSGRQAERRPAQGPAGIAQAFRLEAGRASVAASLPTIGRLVVETDCDRLEFDRLTKPAWAGGIGRDRYGLFADLLLPNQEEAEVTQRLRWCPPGSFVMGSPADEAGRDDDEGPRHEVVIGSGFWLFDTPCTQALWQAVMGTNPSRFQSPTRPVEQVDFAEVQDFLARLNERVPGLDLALPSEAQWEYACRAGTTTATYAGEMHILGENNAPVLDAIAWYGGNSGVGYELEEGYDSSDWPGKQHPHERAGTRPVGLKRPNGWGLHDMLGNVWEWCADHWHESYAGAPGDGSAWLDGDVDGAAPRVVRGGAWVGGARDVRAAFRRRDEPSFRFVPLGFRCARVQGVSQAAVVERRAGAGGPAERSELDAGAGTPRRRAGRPRRTKR